MRMPERHIVGIGGGGTPDAVIDAVLALVSKERPQVMYVGTAQAEDPWATLKTYERFQGRAELRHLEFFPWPPADLRELTRAPPKHQRIRGFRGCSAQLGDERLGSRRRHCLPGG